MSKEFSISFCFEPIDVVTFCTPWWHQLHSTYHQPQVSLWDFCAFRTDRRNIQRAHPKTPFTHFKTNHQILKHIQSVKMLCAYEKIKTKWKSWNGLGQLETIDFYKWWAHYILKPSDLGSIQNCFLPKKPLKVCFKVGHFWPIFCFSIQFWCSW